MYVHVPRARAIEKIYPGVKAADVGRDAVRVTAAGRSKLIGGLDYSRADYPRLDREIRELLEQVH